MLPLGELGWLGLVDLGPTPGAHSGPTPGAHLEQSPNTIFKTMLNEIQGTRKVKAKPIIDFTSDGKLLFRASLIGFAKPMKTYESL